MKLNIVFLFCISSFVLIFSTIGCQTENTDNQPLKNQDNYAKQSIFIPEDTLVTGVPIPAIGKRIPPDSTAPPEIIPALIPQQTKAHQNRQTAQKGTVTLIQKEKLNRITPEKDRLNLTRPFRVDIQKIPAIHPPNTPALPPVFKDNVVYDIRYLDVDQGLNGSYQRTACETRSGYLWFGAWPGGVCRYDGKSFQQFTEKEGLVYSEVNDIIEDRQQNLWIATKQGLSKYDGFSFTNYTLGIDLDIRFIFEDSKGILWLSTLHHGLLQYDGTNFTQLLGEHECLKDGLSNVLERNGNIWVGSYCGLLKYDGNSFTQFQEKDGLLDNRINEITLDQNNDLWIATESGLSQYNGTSFINFNQKGSFVDDAILTILEDKDGQIWLGTAHHSLIKYDGNYFTQYSTNEGLSSNSITDLWQDSYGQLWISTYGGGVNRFNITASFEHLTTYQGLSDNVVHHIVEDQSKHLWMPTDDHGLIKHDGEYFYFYNKQNGLKTNSMQTVMEARNGDLWFGTYDGSGASKFDGQSFAHYGAAQGLHGEIIWSILEDSQGQIWFATSEGLTMFDGQSFTRFTKKEGLIDDYITHVSEDNNGHIWMASEASLTKYDGSSFTHFTTKEGLVDNSVVGMMQDSRGYYWISTYNGLSIYDGTEFYSFTKKQGLESEKVWAIAEDHRGNIWLGTKKGVYLFEIPVRDSVTFADLKAANIQAFHKMDGLKAEDVNVDGICLDSDHTMWLSSGKGLMSLDLEEFYANRNQHIPNLEWNSLQLKERHIDFSNISLRNSEEQTDGLYFEKANAFNRYPTGLQVAYDINHFTFNFIAFDWAAPQHIKYQYQLEGLENNWSQPTASNEVDYRSIPPGNYTFKVKAAGQAKIWSEPIAYQFTVLPPLWLTWWAYAVYFLMLTALLYAIFSFFKNRLILQNELKVKDREAQRLQELDQFKSRLYTNLTHEFRTPLTVILGMTGQIRSEPKKYLNKGTELIESNGKNLLRLINQLLDLSKLENKAFELHFRQGDVIPYLKYITESFQSYAHSKDLSLQVSTLVKQLIMDYDAEQIKQVVSNLITNAIKFTPVNGEISVYISTKNQQLSIEVKDTGIGIAAKDIPYIFDRFYQVSDVNNFTGNGTGIGLAYAQELVHLMNGKILVSSQLHQGTSFQVLLPIHRLAKAAEKGVPKNGNLDWTVPITQDFDTDEFSQQKNTGLPELLIVEDNPDVTIYLKSCLEDLYHLHFAHNGKVGIEKALEHIPDLIISDVMMPEKNGYELCDFLKNDERSSHIPIILLTAKADVSSKMEGLKRGADVYLSKPFNKEELLLRLEKMNQKQKRLKDYFSKNINNEAPILSENLEIEEQEVIQIEHVFIEKVKTIIAKNYHQEQFALPQLCEALDMSRSQLYRKTKALIDVSPSRFIRSYRLQQGKILLETTDFTVSEVAWKVGFKERSHFSKAFNDEFGVYPTSFFK